MVGLERLRPRTVTLTWAVAGALVTLLVVAVRGVAFDYRSMPAHVGLETVDGLVAALGAYLLYGRYRRSLALQDLLICAGLGLLATGSLLYSVVPLALGAHPYERSRPGVRCSSGWSAVPCSRGVPPCPAARHRGHGWGGCWSPAGCRWQR